MTDAQTMVNYFVNYINENGGNPSEWYTGIASEPKVRLGQHKALDSKWAFDDAGSDNVARTIEDHMTKVVKTQGGGGGGDQDSTWVYCYKTTSTTDETA